ncbi:translocon-associated protein subunit alpha-like [Liolophura sinensis]|uniref:translocon-associated protein subunit alpha-like n=1 Tax=Liolophura sinensis TaxID=3198878 RepID=UPI0031598624
MTRFLGKFLLLLLLILPTTVLLVGQGSSVVAHAEDAGGDAVEGEEDEATVETDEGPAGGMEQEAAVTETGEEAEEEDEEDERALKPSPNADTQLLFTKPTGTDLPAGGIVRLLVGFTNTGDKDFIVETMDAAFRYPQDYSFYIQNFTVVKYNTVVEPKRQATFEYVFSPSEAFHSRPFGLTVNLNYKDSEGQQFQSAVFNETINVVELEDGLDGETFFLYVFLAAVGVLLLVGAQQLLATYGKKRLSRPKAPVEMGTQNSDVDYDWLPEETLQEIKRSPGRSPKQSPRQRRSKRQQGSAED